VNKGDDAIERSHKACRHGRSACELVVFTLAPFQRQGLVAPITHPNSAGSGSCLRCMTPSMSCMRLSAPSSMMRDTSPCMVRDRSRSTAAPSVSELEDEQGRGKAPKGQLRGRVRRFDMMTELAEAV
jgi:hypothetical protein